MGVHFSRCFSLLGLCPSTACRLAKIRDPAPCWQHDRSSAIHWRWCRCKKARSWEDTELETLPHRASSGMAYHWFAALEHARASSVSSYPTRRMLISKTSVTTPCQFTSCFPDDSAWAACIADEPCRTQAGQISPHLYRGPCSEHMHAFVQ